MIWLVACSGKDSGVVAEEEARTPTIAFLSPTDGAEVAATGVPVSLQVDYFNLEDPAKHNEGVAEGYVVLSWSGGDDVGYNTDLGTTTTTIDLLLGENTLTADLRFADGDEITETFADFVPTTITVTAE